MPAAASTGRHRYRWLLLLVAAVLLLAGPVAGLVTGGGQGDTGPTREAGSPTATQAVGGLPVVRLADLPAEAARTVELIDAGGPFPEPGHDGGTFGNFEELLPDRPRGWYQEYTVPTPGLDHRGARRIVAGDDGTLYWTADHYSSFSVIRR